MLREEKRAFTTEEVVRELIALVEGKSRADSRLLRRYLVCMVVEKTGYRRAVARVWLASSGAGRSVARRALIAFEEAATPMRNQLDVALRRLRQEAVGK